MTNLLLHEARLIVFDKRDDVPAGNVAVVDDGEPRLVERAPHRTHAPPWNRGPDGSPPDHSREREVVRIDGGAGRLSDPVLPRDVAADRALILVRHPARMRRP